MKRSHACLVKQCGAREDKGCPEGDTKKNKNKFKKVVDKAKSL